MTLFLTSHTGGSQKVSGERFPAPLMTANGFTDQLRIRWKPESRVLFLAADPDSLERNDSLHRCFSQALPMSGLSIRDFTLCDSRNLAACENLGQYDCILLSGGHVPTQNAFFTRLELKEKLKDFSGILIGISAGTMNCAATVYAHPELEGEAVDPDYRRFLPGLGLTELMILPHYQSIKEDVLDGLRVFEDIAYPDSIGRSFLALNDGSYILTENGTSTLFGESYRIHNRVLTRICTDGQKLTL